MNIKFFIYFLFVRFPLLESCSRNLYWRLYPHLSFLQKIRINKVKTSSVSPSPVVTSFASNDSVLDFLYSGIINEDGVLLVHSNLSSIANYGLDLTCSPNL